MKAWIIIGAAGEYSDRSEWAVKGYLDELAAKAEVDRMSAESRQIESEYHDNRYDIDWYSDNDQVAKEIRARVGDPHYACVLSDWPRYHLSDVDIVDLGWPEKENT